MVKQLRTFTDVEVLRIRRYEKSGKAILHYLVGLWPYQRLCVCYPA
jgi:hypothetical protein